MSSPTLPEVPGGVRLVTAELVCSSVEATLRRYLPAWAKACGLGVINDYQQLPDATAISAAALPAVAIACPGLAEPPTLTRRAGQLPRYSATFRVNVAVYDHGQDHHQSAARARTWAAVLRAVLTRHPHLDNLATDLVLVDEAYSLGSTASGEVVRTIGGGQVSLDITVDDVVPTAPFPLALEGESGDPGAPTANALRTTVQVTAR